VLAASELESTEMIGVNVVKADPALRLIDNRDDYWLLINLQILNLVHH
jgi:hypothetical protein